jgi:hypothetical protein
MSSGPVDDPLVSVVVPLVGPVPVGIALPDAPSRRMWRTSLPTRVLRPEDQTS